MFKNNIRILFVFSFCLFSSISFSEITESQKKMLENLPPDQRDSIMDKMNRADAITSDIEETFEDANTLIERPELKAQGQLEPCEECVYGYDFFRYSPSTFASSNNIPISSTYVLGPGDKIEVSYFGSHEEQSVGYISREGILTLPFLTPVNLLGVTYKDAVSLIERRVKTELIGTNVSITLKDLRSISIYLLGQAYKPGSYTISGLSTVTNALFASGGVNKLGSLRNIEIRREGKVIKVYDFYEFLLKGNTNSDVRLQDGDIIFIPYIQKKVRVGSGFKGPHLYEVKDEETIRDLIDMAGGISYGVSSEAKLELNSSNINTNSRFISKLSQDSDDLDRKLKDGDAINIPTNLSLFAGYINITGEVNNPGEYSILRGDTILDVIDRAGGYSDNSFSEGAIFLRKDVAKLEKEGFERSAAALENYIITLITRGTEGIGELGIEPISRIITKLRNEVPIGRQVVDVNYLKLKTDPVLNFRMQSGDFLHIPKRPESISVIGEVLNPSVQKYMPSLSFNEYINLAGGLRKEADKNTVFVVLPNGESQVQNKSLFSRNSSLLPGSTIVVGRANYGRMELAAILTPILSSFATSAAALAVLGRD
jgi:protein involved in polysaccharide export with SLBB domain